MVINRGYYFPADVGELYTQAACAGQGVHICNVIFITPDTPVSGLRLMVEKDVGRLPVISNGSLVGIVSYRYFTYLAWRWYGRESTRCCTRAMRAPGMITVTSFNPGSRCVLYYLEMAGKIAADMGYTVYMVGGVQRFLRTQF